MATYLGTHGGKIQTYSTDPTYPNTGEVWYNSTSNTIKMEATTSAGAWATDHLIKIKQNRIMDLIGQR